MYVILNDMITESEINKVLPAGSYCETVKMSNGHNIQYIVQNTQDIISETTIDIISETTIESMQTLGLELVGVYYNDMNQRVQALFEDPNDKNDN